MLWQSAQDADPKQHKENYEEKQRHLTQKNCIPQEYYFPTIQ